MSSSPPSPVEGLTVRDVRGQAEMTTCVALYRGVMGLRPTDDGINARLLTAMQHNGGYVVGAFVGQDLVGFAYSFLGCDRSAGGIAAPYQYSALAVVAGSMQGRGIGRQLKYAQRERCLADGIGRMRWAFDPLKTRNAHFNLDVLGGEVVALVPAMYGARGFGVDSEDESDRFIVDWPLARPAPPQRDLDASSHRWESGRRVVDGDDLLIAVPARWDRQRREIGGSAATELRRELRDAFSSALESGRRGVSCQRVDADVAVYRFEPRAAPAHPEGD
jgi:predicted GNAT superfamily acetyltransferase